MKRLIAFFLSSLMGALLVGQLFVQPAFAAPSDPYGLNATAMQTPFAQSVSSGKKLPQLIGDIISVALSLVGIIFLVLALYGGFKWMTAQGNEDQVKEARQTIVDATIGIILIVAAYSITNFIFSDVIAPIAGNGAPVSGADVGANGADSNVIGNGQGLAGPKDIQQALYACKYDDGFNGGCKEFYLQPGQDPSSICTTFKPDGVVTPGSCPSVPLGGGGDGPGAVDYCCTYLPVGVKKTTLQTVQAITQDGADGKCKIAAGTGKVVKNAVVGSCSALTKKWCCQGDAIENFEFDAIDQNSANFACTTLDPNASKATLNACPKLVLNKFCCVDNDTDEGQSHQMDSCSSVKDPVCYKKVWEKCGGLDFITPADGACPNGA